MTALPVDIPIGLVVNPAARAVKRRYLSDRPFWRRYVSEQFVRVPRTLEELDEAVARFHDAGVRVMAVLGGDGSLHRLVDAVLRRYAEADAPMVLALAGGTMNGLPRALGTGGPPEKVLRAIVGALAVGAPSVHSVHVLRIADGDGRTRHGFSFATGLVYRAFQDYYRVPEPGITDAVRASMLPLKAALFGGSFYEGLHLDVRSEGTPWMPEPPHTLVASVLDKPLLWFRPFGPPLGDAPAFHLAATSMGPGEIAPRLWSIFRGRCRHPRLRVGRSREATVLGQTGYLIDGDLYASGRAVEVRLSLGPRLQFLVPAPRPGRGGEVLLQ